MPVQVLSSQVAPCRTISCHFLWIDVQICSIFLWTLQALQAEYVQGTENAAVHWERRRTTRPRMEKQNLGAQTQNDSNECSQELTKHVEAGMFLAPIWPWSRNDFTWSKNEWMHTDADLHLRLVCLVCCVCVMFFPSPLQQGWRLFQLKVWKSWAWGGDWEKGRTRGAVDGRESKS